MTRKESRASKKREASNLKFTLKGMKRNKHRIYEPEELIRIAIERERERERTNYTRMEWR